MKILFVGYKNPNFWAVTDYIEKALVQMGHEVLYLDYRGYRLPGRLRSLWNGLEAWDRALINRRIRDAAAGYRPDLFLVIGGYTLEPETVRAAKRSGAKTVLWVADYPSLFEICRALGAHFEHCFYSDTHAIERHPGSRFLPFACLPDVHKPVELFGDDARLYRSDVAFMGTPHPERIALLRAISALGGVDLAIWGPGWDRLPAGHALRPFIRGGSLRTTDFVKAASACKIAFNHMGNPFGPENMCNSRVFELLGCGAFQLVDAKKDVVRLFVSGRELVYYKDEKELLAQVRRYLDHPQERVAISRRAREAALAAHTYHHRLTELLKVCGA